MMLPQVFQTLKASTDVRAIVGTNAPRIYRHGEAPQGVINSPDNATPLPYITWLLVSGVPENNLSENSPVGRQSVQIDCWHASDTGIETLADAVRAALEPVVHITSYQDFPRDPETRRFRASFDADFFGR